MFEHQQRLLVTSSLTMGLARDDILTSVTPTQMTSEDLLTQELEVRMVTVYLCVVLALSLAGNGTLGCVFFSKRQLLTVSNYFVLNLACCQLGMSLVVLPLSVVSLIHERWVLSESWCRCQSYLLVVMMVALHYTLLAISLDRNFAIVNSLRYPSVFTHTLGCGIIAGTWILGLLVGLPPLVGWGAFRFEEHQFLCSINWQTDLAYSFFFLIIMFFLPLLIHLWCYVSIFKAALLHTRRCSKVFPSPTATTTTSTTTTTTTDSTSTDTSAGCIREESTQIPNSRTTSRIITQCKAVKTIILIATAYFVCWMLYVVVALLKCWEVYVSPSMELSSVCLVFLSCILNPVIYGFMNRLTRYEMWKLWNRLCRRACGQPPPSFTDSEDALSSTWSTHLASTRAANTHLWATPSQRLTRNSRGPTCTARGVDEMVTIQEETEAEEDSARVTIERDVIDYSDDDNNKKCISRESNVLTDGSGGIDMTCTPGDTVVNSDSKNESVT